MQGALVRRSRSEWIQICAECDRSGESAVVFARRRGLKLGTLYWWRSLLRRQGGIHAAAGEPRFVELTGHAEWGDRLGLVATVVLSPRVRVDFHELPPVEWLADVVKQC